VTAFVLTEAELLRVSRDIAYSELASMPGMKAQLAARVGEPGTMPLSWAPDSLDIDSLARMQLATAAATWCNAYDAGFEDLFLAKRTAADWAVVMRRAREAGAAQFTFATSGSTGARKLIRHREDILADEARAWAQVLAAPTALGPASAIQRVVVLCPTHHIYGFIWGVLLPLALGVPSVDADLANLPALASGDLVVAVPDQWAWLAASRRAWPTGVQGVSSTAPLPALVHDALTVATAPGAASALARLVQVYGSSETAGIAYRTQSTGAYQLAPGRQRNASDGIDLQLPSGARQTMAVQDQVQWVSDTAFNLLRRNDESVQVAGHNVSPAWVVTQLQQHSAVSQAAVRLDGNTSARLKAYVVLKSPDDHTERQALEQWVLEQLPWYATFSSITYGTSLPRNALGKTADWPVHSADFNAGLSA
jgi:long-chain acyl-CoA synthetase